MKHPRHLRIATWILAPLVREGEREALVGDLIEEYALRARSGPSSKALKWYLQQICASALPLLWGRLRQAGWIATFGVALVAYIAVGIVEFIVNRAIPSFPAASTVGYTLLALLIPFPTVVVIAYFAAGFRRRAPFVLGGIMLLMVTVMALTSGERVPLWYRIAYFVVGPAAAFIGGALAKARKRAIPGV